MDGTALEERFSRLEQRIAELERENQSLRANAPTTAVAPTENAALPRRELLKGAAYAVGAVSLSLMGTRIAQAENLPLIVGSTTNDGIYAPTGLNSRCDAQTLVISNLEPNRGRALDVTSYSGHSLSATVTSPGSFGNALNAEAKGNGHSIYTVKTSEFGHAVLAYQKHLTSLYAAIAGVTSGAGPGLHGRGEGSGNGVWGQIADSAKSQSAILGSTEGTGAAVEGNSILGRGGVFKGKKAAVRLVASSAANKPSTGNRGDLFVDSSGRLWYCKTSGSTTGWKQLA
jgi:hypothetical protein